MRRIVSLTSLLLLLFAVALGGVAQAQGVAKTQFKDAKERYDDGNYEEALQLFQLAWEYSHSPNARLYVGRCFVKLENYKAAYDELRGTVRDAQDKAAEDEKYVETRNAAAAELVLLEPKIGHLIITVDDAVPDAKVTLNGQAVPRIEIGELMTVEPGPVKLVASAEGREDAVREVTIAGGRTQGVALFFARVEGGAPVPQPTAPVAAESELTLLQWVGIGVMGLGVAGLATAGAMGAAAGSKFGALEQACGDQPCSDPAFNDVIDAGKTYELLAYISGGVGLAAIIGGGAMLLFLGEDAGADSAGFAPLPGGGLLSYRGSF